MGTLRSDQGDTRLDSWKRIAAYLDRDLRTVRRWEKERGLPVHRVPGGGRGAIYAFRHEIDAWLLQVNEPPQDSRGRGTEVLPSAQGLGQKDSNGGARLSVGMVGAGKNGEQCASTNSEDSSLSLPPASVIGSHLKFLATIGATLLITLAFVVPLLWLFRTGRAVSSIDQSDPIKISSVSPILPMKNQTIVIRGLGFGLHTPYMNADTAFIAIRDKTAGWAAGRIIPQNWDEVTLNVKRWEDDQIVVTGFSGAYGSREWKLNPSDKIEIAIWNPQSGRGPALYHLAVLPLPNE